MRIKLLILSILMYTNYSFSQESLTSDFYFPIHQNVINSLLQEHSSGLSENTLEDFSIVLPYKTSINGITLNFDYSYELLPSMRNGVQAQFSASVKNLSIDIDAVSTQDNILQQAGSIILDIAIQGECRNLNLELPGQTINLNGDVVMDNSTTDLPSLLVELNPFEVPNQWHLATQSCQGPAGYQTAIEEAILAFVTSNQATLRDLVETQVNKVANEAFDNVLSKILAPQQVPINNEVQMVFAPSQLHFAEETQSFTLKGTVTTDLENGAKQQTYIPFAWSADENQTTASGLIVSQKYLQKVIQSLQNNGNLRMTLESQNNKSFKRLHRSRFLQFFTFPDLMNFGKHENFLLETYLEKQPDVHFYQQNNRFTWFSVDAEIKVDMKAPKPDGYTPYMYYHMPTSVKAWMTVHNEQLVLGFAQPRSDFKASWDSNYVKKYKTQRRFSTNTFHSSFNQALQEQRLKINLPSIDFEGIPALIPQKIEANEEWIQLIFGTKTHQ